MYSLKNFWVPFIVMLVIMIVVSIVSGTTDPAFGVMLIGIFYFYNRGVKVSKKEEGR